MKHVTLTDRQGKQLQDTLIRRKIELEREQKAHATKIEQNDIEIREIDETLSKLNIPVEDAVVEVVQLPLAGASTKEWCNRIIEFLLGSSEPQKTRKIIDYFVKAYSVPRPVAISSVYSKIKILCDEGNVQKCRRSGLRGHCFFPMDWIDDPSKEEMLKNYFY